MKPIECERCGQMAEYSCNDEYLCDMHTREVIDGEVRELFVHNRTLSLSIIPIESVVLEATQSDASTCPYCGVALFTEAVIHICSKRKSNLRG